VFAVGLAHCFLSVCMLPSDMEGSCAKVLN